MAKYIIEEMNNLNGAGTLNYPRIQQQGQTTLAALAKEISMRGAFTQGDVLGVVSELTKVMAIELGKGNSVKIEGLGIFSVSLGIKKGKELKDPSRMKHINAQRITIRGINFRTQKGFATEVNTHFRPTRSKRLHPRSNFDTTPEERLLLALKFLQTRPFLRVADYCTLTGLLATTAQKELVKWSNDPNSGLTFKGYGSHKVYVVAKDT